MDDPSDPDDSAFQRLLNREILLSERRRMLILAALQAFILFLILLDGDVRPELRPVDLSRPSPRARGLSGVLGLHRLRTVRGQRGHDLSSPRSQLSGSRPLHERACRNELSDRAALSPRRISVVARHHFRHVASAALFSVHHSLDFAALTSRFRPSRERSPRSSSSSSLSSRCILSGEPTTRTSALAII